MKKIISLILMIAMLISVSAFAEEEFSLHNGVKFGMTSEEVAAIEEASGFKYHQYDTHGTIDGKIAGQEDASIFFYYNNSPDAYDIPYCEDNGLYKCTYGFSNGSYDTLYDALVSKYGQATYDLNDQHISVSQSFYNTSNCSWNTDGDKISLIRQWLVPYNDTYILIDLSKRSSSFDMGFGAALEIVVVCINYMVLPYEVVAEINETNSQMVNDL